MSSEKHLNQLHVCVILSDDVERHLFQEAILELDFEVRLSQFPSVGDLLKSLAKRTFDPDMIFLDMNLSQISGLDCLLKIKKRFPSLNKSIGILSSKQCLETMKTALSLGARFYAVKPGSFAGLKELIRTLISFHTDLPEKRR